MRSSSTRTTTPRPVARATEREGIEIAPNVLLRTIAAPPAERAIAVGVCYMQAVGNGTFRQCCDCTPASSRSATRLSILAFPPACSDAWSLLASSKAARSRPTSGRRKPKVFRRIFGLVSETRNFGAGPAESNSRERSPRSEIPDEQYP